MALKWKAIHLLQDFVVIINAKEQLKQNILVLFVLLLGYKYLINLQMSTLGNVFFFQKVNKLIAESSFCVHGSLNSFNQGSFSMKPNSR